MTRHVHVLFGQNVRDYQKEQIETKLETFHVEHLIPMVFPDEKDLDWELDWSDTNELRFVYAVSTAVKQDYDINRQLLRYLELSVVPLVFYDDDVVLQLESHDADINDDGDCDPCGNRWSAYSRQTVLSTSNAYNEFIGA